MLRSRLDFFFFLCWPLGSVLWAAERNQNKNIFETGWVGLSLLLMFIAVGIALFLLGIVVGLASLHERVGDLPGSESSNPKSKLFQDARSAGSVWNGSSVKKGSGDGKNLASLAAKYPKQKFQKSPVFIVAGFREGPGLGLAYVAWSPEFRPSFFMALIKAGKYGFPPDSASTAPGRLYRLVKSFRLFSLVWKAVTKADWPFWTINFPSEPADDSSSVSSGVGVPGDPEKPLGL